MPRLTDLVAIGQIAGSHGVKGELKVKDFAGYSARFKALKRVFLPGAGDNAIEYPITGARAHQGMPLLTLAGIDDRDKADALRGQTLYIASDDRQPLAEGEYYQTDLLGLTVLLPDGAKLGELVDIIETGANDVYEVRGPGGPFLIPAIKDVIGKVDLEARTMQITPLPGLLDGGEVA